MGISRRLEGAGADAESIDAGAEWREVLSGERWVSGDEEKSARKLEEFGSIIDRFPPT